MVIRTEQWALKPFDKTKLEDKPPFDPDEIEPNEDRIREMDEVEKGLREGGSTTAEIFRPKK